MVKIHLGAKIQILVQTWNFTCPHEYMIKDYFFRTILQAYKTLPYFATFEFECDLKRKTSRIEHRNNLHKSVILRIPSNRKTKFKYGSNLDLQKYFP